MSSVKYFAPDVERTEFQSIVIVVTSAVGVLASYMQIVIVECFCNKTWDVRVECALIVVPFEVDSDV